MSHDGGNLYDDARTPFEGERFDTLVQLPGVRVERIVSSVSPEPVLYDQPHDEWVLLLRGEAGLEVDGREVGLRPGDYLRLPARTPHRVLRASAGAVWLAVHADATRPALQPLPAPPSEAPDSRPAAAVRTERPAHPAPEIREAVELSREGVLATAMRGEAQARAFYESAAREMTDPEAQRVLQGLAEEEAQHRATLGRLFRARFPEAYREAESRADSGDVALLPPQVRLEDLARLQPLELVVVALWEEHRILRLYQVAARDAAYDAELRATLEQLVRLERGHIRILSGLRELLGGPPASEPAP